MNRKTVFCKFPFVWELETYKEKGKTYRYWCQKPGNEKAGVRIRGALRLGWVNNKLTDLTYRLCWSN
jgi:hypothetical protein